MKKILLYSTLCACVLAACSVPEPEIVSYSNMKFIGIQDSIFDFSVDAHVYNPSGYNYELRELNFEIDYDQKAIGQGRLEKTVKVGSKDTVALPMLIGLNAGQLEKKHRQLFINPNAVFQFEGTATAVHPLKTISKDFIATEHFNIKEILTEHLFNEYVVFGNLELKKMRPFSRKGITKTDLKIAVEIFNNQSFDFQIEDLALALYSKNSQELVMEGVMNTSVAVYSQQLNKIPIEITSNNLNIFKDIGRFFLGSNDAKYRGMGHMTIRVNQYVFTLPIQREFDMKTQLFGRR